MRFHADGQTNHHLIYDGPLPPLRGKIVHPMARYRLKQRARKVFGEFPQKFCATRKAIVTIIRVLGPRQREMDTDNLAIQVGGLLDALKPSYIVDDAPKWAAIDWLQDATRRHMGPRIEVSIVYEENSRQ